MTPFAKWVKRVTEKFVGVFYEGPEPPQRLGDMATAFSNAHPHATRGEWVAFARELAGECYKAGFVRGFEYVERDPAHWRDDLPPDVVADMLDPEWRQSDPIELAHNPDAPVEHTYPEDVVERHQLQELEVLREDRILKGARKG